MAPEPRRKDEGSHREVPEGQKPAEEGEQQAVEEFTDYREKEGGAGTRDASDPAAEREADLQPDGDRPQDRSRQGRP